MAESKIEGVALGLEVHLHGPANWTREMNASRQWQCGSDRVYSQARLAHRPRNEANPAQREEEGQKE